MIRAYPIYLAILMSVAYILGPPVTAAAVINPATLEREAGMRTIPPESGRVVLEQVDFDFEAGRVVDSD